VQARRPQLPSEPKYAKSSDLQSANQPSFTDDEVQNLLDIFQLFDKEQQDQISVKDLETIMASLQRDPNEVRDLLDRFSETDTICFQQFLDIMQQIENKIVHHEAQEPEQQSQPQPNAAHIQADSKVLDFLRLLEEYRRKCEEQGNYAEARKSRAKFEELLRKETQRQKNNIRAAQDQELQNIEAA
jgi:hypothetical protein